MLSDRMTSARPTAEMASFASSFWKELSAKLTSRLLRVSHACRKGVRMSCKGREGQAGSAHSALGVRGGAAGPESASSANCRYSETWLTSPKIRSRPPHRAVGRPVSY